MSFSSLQFAAGAANGRPLFLPLPSWPPAGSPLFRSAVRSIQPAKQPPGFNLDGRFSLNQPLLFVATATNNCPAIAVAAVVGFTAFLLCCPQPSARETAVSLQPRRPFFSPSTFVVRCESNEQLPSHWRSGCRWVHRFFALLSTAVTPQNGRQFSTKTAVFLSLIERKSRQKKERIRIRQKKKRRSFAALRKSGVSFCLPEQPASTPSAERSALR